MKPGHVRDGRAVTLVVVAAVVLFANRAPFTNEYVYLVRLRHVARPEYLAGDWSMDGSFGENFVFNTLLTPVARVMPIIAVAWIGRVATWTVLARLVVSFGHRLGIGPYATAVATIVWMPWQLRIMGADWMFGSFEAKPVAYCALVGALIAAFDGRVPVALVAAGATLSLHPGVGVMAAPAVIVALLIEPTTRRATVRLSPIALLLGAPGVYGIVRDFDGSSGSADLWKLFSHALYPFHLDPWHFGALTVVALASMLVVTTIALRDIGSRPARMLITFLWCTAIPAAIGIGAFETGNDALLRFFPFRVFPIVTSFAFALTTASTVARRGSGTPATRRVVAAAACTALIAVVAQNPVRSGAFLARRTVTDWTSPRPELQRTYDWIRLHTPRGAVVIVPPGIDPHYDTQRHQVATFGVPRWDAVGAWESRMLTQLGSSNDSARRLLLAGTNIDDLYRALTPLRIKGLAREFGASILVSDVARDLPVLHRDGQWVVYRISP